MVLCQIGCSDQVAEEKINFAKQTVETALKTWQQGGKPEDLEQGTEPIEFHDDDWDRSARLIEYELRQSYMETDGTARCAVRLKVQTDQKSPREIECTYQIVTEPKVIVARDPMS